jgi:hypothetical protein
MGVAVVSGDPARTRHDDRLHEAVRRLGLPATVHSVTRRAKSAVEVASRVVPGFCRAAVEAACMEAVRRRRIGRGATHDAVEDLLAANAKMYPLIALAFFDDESRTNDVLPRLQRLHPLR